MQRKPPETRSLISFTGDLKEAAKDADLVIEAVLERIDLKRKIFTDLDKFAQAGAILATNSSFIVSHPGWPMSPIDPLRYATCISSTRPSL